MNNARKPRFYHPHPIQVETYIELESDAAQHISRVLRMNVDEAILLFDNQGGEYLGILKNITPKATQVYISEHFDHHNESCLKLHLAQSLVRADRMDLIIQKATELGVYEITPLITTRSIIKLDQKTLTKKMQHWSNIIISAAQQCGRTQLPILNQAVKLNSFLKTPFEGINIYFDPTETDSLKSITPPPKAARLLVGPESGLDDNEIKLALDHQFKGYTLGPRVLRTETAAIAAVSALQVLYGDLA